MKKMKQKAIIMLAIGTLTCSAVAFAFANGTEAVAAENANFQLESIIESNYTRGSYLQVPSASYVIDGNKYLATHKLVAPSGNSATEKTVKLSELGEYTITYTVENGELEYVDEYTFTVTNKCSSLFTYSPNVIAEDNASLPTYIDTEKYNASSEQGLEFTVDGSVSTSVIQYNQIIDLKEIGFNKKNSSETEKSFVELLFTPENNEEREADRLQIVLTDAYDPNNYLKIDLVAPHVFGLMDQPEIKTRVKAAPNDLYDGLGIIGNSYLTTGTVAQSSMYGRYKDNAVNSISLYYDYENNELWCNPINGIPYIVMDQFENADIVGAANRWYGFTTGEVYLSFVVDSILEEQMLYNDKGQMSFTVLNIGGKACNGDFSSYPKADILVYNNEFDYQNDYVVAGEGLYFDIFDAKGFVENYGEVDMQTKVYFGDDLQELPVRNGRFDLAKAGKYTIVYSIDSVVGKYQRQITLTAKSAFDIGDELAYTFNPSIATNGYVGDRIYLYEGNAVGGVGLQNAAFKVSTGAENIQIDYSTEVPSFVMEKVGVYKIECVISDAIGTRLIKTLDVECQSDEKPRIILPPLPKAYLIGHSYTFPVAEGKYVDQNGEKTVLVSTWINGEDYTDKSYTVAEDFTVIYKAVLEDNSSIKSESEWNCKAVSMKTGEEYLESYFYATDAELENTAIGMNIKTTKADNFISFLRPIPVELLELKFIPHDGHMNFDGIEFIITDSLDRTQAVKFAIQKLYINEKAYTSFYLNDSFIATIAGDLNDIESSALGFSYNYKTHMVYEPDGALLDIIKYYSDGELFAGFESGYVYVDMCFTGVVAESAITITEIASQVFASYIQMDSAGPTLFFSKQLAQSSKAFVGDKFTAPSVKAWDMFNQVQVKVKISDPDGIVIYEGSISNDYIFDVTKVGSYEIKYIADDDIKNRNAKTFYVSAWEKSDPPTITLSEIKHTAKVGETYTFATATITGVDAAMTLYIANEEMTKTFINGDAYVFEEAGVYTVYYYVVDAYNNIVLKSYQMEVFES